MPRVKRGVTARARHKKVIEQAKGYQGRRKNVYRVAKQAVIRAGATAYRDRRQRKRQFRALWIARINAAGTGVTASPPTTCRTSIHRSPRLTYAPSRCTASAISSGDCVFSDAMMAARPSASVSS